MLSHLFEAERDLPLLLEDEGSWNDVFIDYHAPFVERLWRPYGEHRLYLHRIHPCHETQALLHPHPWPSAMRLHGTYKMLVGYGSGDAPPPIACSLIMPAGTAYEMIDPDGWHAVCPVDRPALSVMLTGMPWGRPAPKSNKPLMPLTREARAQLFQFFREIYAR